MPNSISTIKQQQPAINTLIVPLYLSAINIKKHIVAKSNTPIKIIPKKTAESDILSQTKAAIEKITYPIKTALTTTGSNVNLFIFRSEILI